jgi:hypothetical protein
VKKVKAVIIISQTSNQIATMEERYCSSKSTKRKRGGGGVHIK